MKKILWNSLIAILGTTLAIGLIPIMAILGENLPSQLMPGLVLLTVLLVFMIAATTFLNIKR